MQKMKWIEVLAVIILSVDVHTNVRGQVLWKNAQSWKLYDEGDSSFSLSVDSLKGLRYYQLNTDSMKCFLDSVTLLPNDVQPASMGAYLTTCTFEGATRKVLISYYAGFFYDENTKRYYQISSLKRADWRNYLDACLTSVQ